MFVDKGVIENGIILLKLKEPETTLFIDKCDNKLIFVLKLNNHK